MFGWLGVAMAADPTWHVLRSPQAEASSHLESNWNKYQENYHPTYVLDENPATAWVEGVDGDGIGEWIELPVSRVASARQVRLKVRNGYQKSDTLLTANAAAKDVTIELRDGERVIGTRKVALERKMGWQEVVIPVPAGKGLDAVRMRVDTVIPGRSYKDTCISDVLVEVDSDVPYASAAEAGKLATAKSWIATRLETAKQFAAGGFTTPYANTAYSCTSDEPPPAAAAIEGKLAPLRPVRTRLAAGTTWVRADPVGKIPEPDGTWDFKAVVSLLRTDGVGFLESASEKGRLEAPVGLESNWWSGRQWSAFHIEGPKTLPTAGWARSHEVFEERGTTVRDTDWTFVWSEGRLQTLYVTRAESEDVGSQLEPGHPSPPADQGHSELVIVPHWTADGKIDRWEGWEKGKAIDECDGADCFYTRHWTCAGA